MLQHWQQLVICLCVCYWVNKLCGDQHMGRSRNYWMENPHSLTSSGLSLFQATLHSFSVSCASFFTAGEKAQIRLTLSRMNHSAITFIAWKKKKKRTVQQYKRPSLNLTRKFLYILNLKPHVVRTPPLHCSISSSRWPCPSPDQASHVTVLTTLQLSLLCRRPQPICVIQTMALVFLSPHLVALTPSDWRSACDLHLCLAA